MSLASRIASASSSNGSTDDDRAEDLLAPVPVGRVVGEQHGRREPEARARPGALPRERHVGAVHVGRHRVALRRPRSAGPSRRVSQRRVARTRNAVHRRLQQLQEPVVHRALHQDPGPGAAVLAGVVEHRVRRAPRPRFSRSASAKTMLALLPPSSSVTRFTWSAQPAMIRLPTSVEPVKHDLARPPGGSTNRSPTTEPLPGSTVNTPSGQAGLQRQLAQPQRGQRGQLGRLEHHGVAGGQRRARSPSRRSASGSSTARSRRPRRAARGT